ncbi:hypothetical protein RJT34_07735 [Clitoria ternatea]|uniref:Uncharacterized protein n=1 Tax=Clitoria ternatea TaxID=43366 RepID=A0AAN9K4Z1_CLITE
MDLFHLFPSLASYLFSPVPFPHPCPYPYPYPYPYLCPYPSFFILIPISVSATPLSFSLPIALVTAFSVMVTVSISARIFLGAVLVVASGPPRPLVVGVEILIDVAFLATRLGLVVVALLLLLGRILLFLQKERRQRGNF